MIKKIPLGFNTKAVVKKTRSKETKEISEITLRRVEINNEGVFVGVDEIPGEMFKIADKMPKALETAIDAKLLELIEDPTERAKRLAEK